MSIYNGMIIDPRMLEAIQRQQAQQMQPRPVAGPPQPAPVAAPPTTEPVATGLPDVPVADPSTSAPTTDDAPPAGWTVKGAGDYYFNDGTHDMKVAATDAPPEVAAYALKKYPAPGVIAAGKDQYRVADGKLSKYVPSLGKWGDVADDVVGTLPEEVRKSYVEAKSKTDQDFRKQIYSQPMSGNITPTDDQIKKQEKNIDKISSDMSHSRGLEGIYSPETLEIARQQATVALDAAKASGDKATVEAATKRVAELKDTHVQATAEGGYLKFTKSPLGDGYVMEKISPKETSDKDSTDWTQNPALKHGAASAMASGENREAAKALTNDTMFNANADRLIHDYIGPYAQYYRTQQLAGNPLGHTDPELMVKKLAEEMKTNPDAAIKTVSEMQKTLAEVYGKGYMALTPGVHAQGVYNDGRMDPISPIIPSQPTRSYTSTTALVDDPKKKTGAPVDRKEANFIIPNYNGKLDVAANATQSVRDNAPVDTNRTLSLLNTHEDSIYKESKRPIQNYKVPSVKKGEEGQLVPRPDSADKNTAFDQWLQAKLMQNGGNNEFKKAYADTMVTALEQHAAQIALHAKPTNATTTAKEDEEDNPLGTSTKKKSPVLDPKAKDDAMTEIFGSPKFVTEVNKKKVYREWSEPGVVRKWAEGILNRPKTAHGKNEIWYPDTHVNNPSAAAKTLHILEGVAAGRNGHIEIDTRLRSASNHIMNGMNGLLGKEADEFMRANSEYFTNNLQTGTGDNVYRQQEVWDAAKSTMIGQALQKQMGMTLQQPK